MSDSTYERHESYGLIRITRIGGGARLFGTAMEIVPNTIRLEICEGAVSFETRLLDGVITENHGDGKSPAERSIVVVDMSAAQWAEALTTMGVYPGIPVTIRRREGKMVEPVPDTHRTPLDRIQDEVEAATQESRKGNTANEITRKIRNFLLDTKLSQKDQRYLMGLVSELGDQGSARMEFAVTMVKESTQKLISAARTEIDAAMQRVIAQAGLKALQGTKTKMLKGDSD